MPSAEEERQTQALVAVAHRDSVTPEQRGPGYDLFTGPQVLVILALALGAIIGLGAWVLFIL